MYKRQTDFRGKFGGPPFGLQSVTAKQLGEALRQVQEAVIQGVCEKTKALGASLDLCRDLSMSLPLDIHLYISKTGTVPFKGNQALLEESLKLGMPSEGFM